MFGITKGRYQAWAVQQRGKPILLLISAVGFSASLLIGYRYIYKPWARRKMLSESDEYAKIMYEHEIRQR